MSKLPRVTGKQVIKALEKIEFRIIRQKGSHIRLKHQDGRTVTVPVHSGKVIGKGLLTKIIRDAEITKEEFIRLLNS